MKILLTGSTGMVGRNILDHPDSKNYKFICPTRSELDLTNYDNVIHNFRRYNPDMIIHAAGKVGGIKANIDNPVSFLVDNLQMGVNVILSSFKLKIKKLINLGSSCMYPRKGQNPLNEKTILTGQLEPTNEGYALAKIVSQRLSDYIYRENPEIKYKTIIPCNLYGRYDDFNPVTSHLIPAIVSKTDQAIQSKSDIEIWGEGNSRREFMYAGDFANAIYFAIRNYELLETTMNIGLGYDYSINEYYNKVGKLMHYNGEYYHNLAMPDGMRQKLVSIEKQKKVGWEPVFNLEEGLKKIIEYYYEFIK